MNHKAIQKPLLSFCTVAMNRLHHLRQTLPVNMNQNNSDSIQFVLLDYNSTDGLEDYIKTTFPKETQNGKLVYYKNPTASYFNRSHSRNMIFRLADGEILCNIDADNYAGPGFGESILNLFSSQKNICLTGLNNKYNIPDASGKLCIRKDDFLNITGYDERFEGYGFEDNDIVNRLFLNGIQPFILNQPHFLRVITHDNIERFTNERLYKNLHSIYVRYINFSNSELLFLFNDHSFKSGTITNNYTEFSGEEFAFSQPDYSGYKFSLAAGDWENGDWTDTKQEVILINNAKEVKYKRIREENQELLKNSRKEYYRVRRNSMISEGIYFFTQMSNRVTMLRNLAKRTVKVNCSFGDGLVYRNFKNERFIKICNQ